MSMWLDPLAHPRPVSMPSWPRSASLTPHTAREVSRVQTRIDLFPHALGTAKGWVAVARCLSGHARQEQQIHLGFPSVLSWPPRTAARWSGRLVSWWVDGGVGSATILCRIGVVRLR